MNAGCRKVAVLGAGIMGCCAALNLAQAGFTVSLFEQQDEPLTGASRWNEGKIHLGFLYAASRNLDTARQVLPGGLLFRPLMEELLGQSIEPWIASRNEHYLVHRNSVISLEGVREYFRRVSAMVFEQPDFANYLVKPSRRDFRELTSREVNALAASDWCVGGFLVPERSVNTQALADALGARVRCNARIEFLGHSRVLNASQSDGPGNARWQVHSENGDFGPYGAVINALWAGRPEVDRRVLGKTDALTHHRYRVSAFVRTSKPVDQPSAVIAAGPFGDVKNYDDRNFYMSWYPAGLRVVGNDVVPPVSGELDAPERQKIYRQIVEGLSRHLQGIRAIDAAAENIRIEGGWVYAQGQGSLVNPNSSLHHRALIGLKQYGSYYSIDTGKYSVAPLLAQALTNLIG